MKINERQVAKLRDLVRSKGFPEDTITNIGRRIIIENNEVIVRDGELKNLVEQVIKPKPKIEVTKEDEKPKIEEKSDKETKPKKEKKRGWF